MMIKNVLFQVLFIALGCILNAQSEGEFHKFTEFPNISYANTPEVAADSLRQLNLLVPTEVQKPPLLLWIGGGAWSFVDRNIEMELCRKFAAAGIAVASVGHRLSKGSFSEKRKETGVQHPEHIKDVAMAFKWLLENANAYGYDRNTIFVGGFSSGAHLAALLGMDKKYLQQLGLDTDLIKGLLPVSGTYDIVDYYHVFKNHESEASRALAETHVKDVFGETAGFTKASPVTYIDQLKLPMLLISDNALDKYTRLFETELKKINYPHFEVYYETRLNHGELWHELSTSDKSKVRTLMITFIKTRS